MTARDDLTSNPPRLSEEASAPVAKVHSPPGPDSPGPFGPHCWLSVSTRTQETWGDRDETPSRVGAREHSPVPAHSRSAEVSSSLRGCMAEWASPGQPVPGASATPLSLFPTGSLESTEHTYVYKVQDTGVTPPQTPSGTRTKLRLPGTSHLCV